MVKRVLDRLGNDPRLASIYKGSATGLLSRLVTLGVSAISLPLNVRYLGKEEYGIWITISGTVVMLNLLDLGIASTLTNVLSKAYADDDQVEAVHAYSTAFWLTAAVAAFLGLIITICWPFVNWASLFHLADASTAVQAKRCVVIAVVACLINLPLSLSGKVGAAYRELHLMNYAAMVGAVFSLLAIVGGILLHCTLSGLMLAYCASTVISNAGINLWLWAIRRPWLKPAPWQVSTTMARSLFGQGSLFFILQLCGVVVFNTDNLVITHYLGPQEVTPYSVAWRLVSYASLLQQLLIPAAWPVLSEAYQSGDMAWIRSTYKSLVRKSLSAVVLVSVGIGLFGRPLVETAFAGQYQRPIRRCCFLPSAVSSWKLPWRYSQRLPTWHFLFTWCSGSAPLA